MKNVFFILLIGFGLFFYDKFGTIVKTNSLSNFHNEHNFIIDYKKYSERTIKYFNKVTTETEFSSENIKPLRWNKNIKIYVKGKKPDFLIKELHKVVSELNDIIESINIEFVDDEFESNFIVFFGSRFDYAKICPSSEGLTDNNYGLFVISGTNNIDGGSMYVDTERPTSTTEKKHLLREELTQSLGLFNDTYDYPNSIFYQGWTETTKYADIDIELIKMLYN